MSRLSDKYNKEIVTEFLSDYKNKLAVPKIIKVVVSCGIGKFRDNEKMAESVKNNLAEITGQAPKVTHAKKAISGFKVRIGENVGYMVTLRGEKMYAFLDKLANIVLPRVRDFRGLDIKSFDKLGNFNLGVREHIVFPEIAQHAENLHSLEVTIVTTAKDAKQGKKLLEMLGFPFKKENNG